MLLHKRLHQHYEKTPRINAYVLILGELDSLVWRYVAFAPDWRLAILVVDVEIVIVHSSSLLNCIDMNQTLITNTMLYAKFVLLSVLGLD